VIALRAPKEITHFSCADGSKSWFQCFAPAVPRGFLHASLYATLQANNHHAFICHSHRRQLENTLQKIFARYQVHFIKALI